MDEPPRSRYVTNLASLPLSEVPARSAAGIEIRGVREHDDAELGLLMERAYAGTIDDDLGDNTDGELEVLDWRGSGGRPDASVVAMGDDGAISACLTTLDTGGDWWIAYVFTDPGQKAQGAGLAVVMTALERLRAAGALDVQAVVTDGNTPSERLMARAGFVRTGPD